MNTRDEIKRVISSILQSFNFPNAKIVLFGSRARNDYNQDSDWDFLIIVPQDLTRNEKHEISYQIRRILAKKHIQCDIIIRSESEIESLKKRVNSVTKTALEEGVFL